MAKRDSDIAYTEPMGLLSPKARAIYHETIKQKNKKKKGNKNKK